LERANFPLRTQRKKVLVRTGSMKMQSKLLSIRFCQAQVQKLSLLMHAYLQQMPLMTLMPLMPLMPLQMRSGLGRMMLQKPLQVMTDLERMLLTPLQVMTDSEPTRQV